MGCARAAPKQFIIYPRAGFSHRGIRDDLGLSPFGTQVERFNGARNIPVFGVEVQKEFLREALPMSLTDSNNNDTTATCIEY